MAQGKGKIIEIGEFDGQGRPIGWTFSGEGLTDAAAIQAIALSEDGVSYAGYTIAELHEIKKMGIIPE